MSDILLWKRSGTRYKRYTNNYSLPLTVWPQYYTIVFCSKNMNTLRSSTSLHFNWVALLQHVGSLRKGLDHIQVFTSMVPNATRATRVQRVSALGCLSIHRCKCPGTPYVWKRPCIWRPRWHSFQVRVLACGMTSPRHKGSGMEKGGRNRRQEGYRNERVQFSIIHISSALDYRSSPPPSSWKGSLTGISQFTRWSSMLTIVNLNCPKKISPQGTKSIRLGSELRIVSDWWTSESKP